MSGSSRQLASIDRDGWMLVSAEERARAHPGFDLPSSDLRRTLQRGQAVQLLFEIETREHGRVIDRGVDRMWVIVKSRTDGGYAGVLDSDPGQAENLRLRAGDEIVFGPEHIVAIDQPPRDYVLAKYGPEFFEP